MAALRTILPALLLLLGTAGPTALAAQIGAAQGGLRGQVLDEETGEGVAGVEVIFLDARERGRARAITDSLGLFRLSRVPAGRFSLRASRIGYADVTTPQWSLARADTLIVEIRIAQDAVLLAPLEIVARARPAPSAVLDDFRWRMERGHGTYFGRAEIVQRNPGYITDLLRTVPGVRVVSTGRGRADMHVEMGRALPGQGGGACPVQVFLDGRLVTPYVGGGTRRTVDPGFAIDDLVSPSDLEGVEVYRGVSTVPAEFMTPEARCGVVALWTRRGAPPGGSSER
jgi:hypothetical protein